MLIMPLPTIGACVMANSQPPEDQSTARWRWPFCYGFLLVIGVPWYWPHDDTSTWLGMPVWALVSIGASLLVSILVSWQLSRPWRFEAAEDMDEGNA